MDNKYECIKKIQSDIEDIKHAQALIIKELRKKTDCKICKMCEGRGRVRCAGYTIECTICSGTGEDER